MLFLMLVSTQKRNLSKWQSTSSNVLPFHSLNWKDYQELHSNIYNSYSFALRFIIYFVSVVRQQKFIKKIHRTICTRAVQSHSRKASLSFIVINWIYLHRHFTEPALSLISAILGRAFLKGFASATSLFTRTVATLQ